MFKAVISKSCECASPNNTNKKFAHRDCVLKPACSTQPYGNEVLIASFHLPLLFHIQYVRCALSWKQNIGSEKPQQCVNMHRHVSYTLSALSYVPSRVHVSMRAMLKLFTVRKHIHIIYGIINTTWLDYALTSPLLYSCRHTEPPNGFQLN